MNDTKNQRQKYTNKFFMLGIEIIFYFGIPAFLGMLIGNYIKEKYELNLYIPILFGTYILSWAIVLIRYRSIKKSK